MRNLHNCNQFVLLDAATKVFAHFGASLRRVLCLILQIIQVAQSVRQVFVPHAKELFWHRCVFVFMPHTQWQCLARGTATQFKGFCMFKFVYCSLKLKTKISRNYRVFHGVPQNLISRPFELVFLLWLLLLCCWVIKFFTRFGFPDTRRQLAMENNLDFLSLKPKSRFKQQILEIGLFVCFYFNISTNEYI